MQRERDLEPLFFLSVSHGFSIEIPHSTEDHLVQPAGSILQRIASKCFLTISSKGDSVTPLGNLFQKT